jgi:hypothetical protein
MKAQLLSSSIGGVRLPRAIRGLNHCAILSHAVFFLPHEKQRGGCCLSELSDHTGVWSGPALLQVRSFGPGHELSPATKSPRNPRNFLPPRSRHPLTESIMACRPHGTDPVVDSGLQTLMQTLSMASRCLVSSQSLCIKMWSSISTRGESWISVSPRHIFTLSSSTC